MNCSNQIVNTMSIRMKAMNSTLYISRCSKSNNRIQSIIKNYGLIACYTNKKETILKSEKMLLSIKKRYFFIKIFSEEYKALQEEILKFIFK